MEPINPFMPKSFEEKKAVIQAEITLSQEQSLHILEQLKNVNTTSDDESRIALMHRLQAFRDNMAGSFSGSSEDVTLSSNSDSEELPVPENGVSTQDIERCEQLNAEINESVEKTFADVEASQQTIRLAKEICVSNPIVQLNALNVKMEQIQNIVEEDKRQLEAFAEQSEMIDNLVKNNRTHFTYFTEASHELLKTSQSKIGQIAHQAFSGLNTIYRTSKEKIKDAWNYFILSKNKLVHGVALGALMYGCVKTMPPQLTFAMSTAGLVYLFVKPKLNL
jgi:hypothetical protein